MVLGEDGSLTIVALDGTNLWEDEDDKAFYTCLPQLKAILPSILYSESEKAVSAAAVQVERGCLVGVGAMSRGEWVRAMSREEFDPGRWEECVE